MTTDQLERDLRTLAGRQAGDEHLRLAIRATLAEQLEGRRPRSRVRTGLALGSAAVTAAALAAAAIAVIGTDGSGPSAANAAILAHVTRALSPPADMIVHVREVGVLSDGTRVSAEWWQETNPPHAFRLIKSHTGGQLDDKGKAGGEQGEGAADGTTRSQYDAGTNTITEQPDSTVPPLVDPIESVRAGLVNGTAQVGGTATIDGQSLIKIELPNGVVGYFDRTDYRPLYLDNPQRGGSVVRTRVTAYEELSITPESERLLSITAQHPRATIVTGSDSTPSK